LEKVKLSLVCPAYHDEKNIGPLVARALDALSPACGEVEIIIVEDGSPDGTARAADELAGRHPEVTALHHERNLGHGAALATGIRAARHPVIALMDGDGQYDPGDITGMLDMLGRCDLVQGRRPAYPNGRTRFLLSRLYNVCLRAMFGTPFRDLGCSLKVLKREVTESAWPESSGIFMQGELVLRAHFAGFRVEEMDVKCALRESGRSSSISVSNATTLLRDMLRLRAQLRGPGNTGGE